MPHTSPLGSRDLVRALNRAAVLDAVRAAGPIARTEIAGRTGLSAATISAITADLIAEDLIFEKEAGHSSGGRRPILLALNPRGRFVVGLKLMEGQVVGALTDLEATVLANRRQPFAGADPETAVAAMSQVAAQLLAEGEAGQQRARPAAPLLGVGLGLAGIVDPDHASLRYSPIFGWRDVPIGDLLQARVHAPVHVGNDVNTLTLTEKWFGAGRGLQNFLTVTIGRGVGLGIVVNGQIYRGTGGGAGEFGHTVVDAAGPRCACGNRGCLETYVADPALLRLAAEAAASGRMPGAIDTVADLLALAQAGQPAARAVYAQAGAMLGLGVANLINILSPQRIIFSGEGVRAGELIFAPMRQAIAAHVMPDLAADTEIAVDVWNDDAWARGAAGLVLQELFESPVYRNAVRPAPQAASLALS